MPPWTHRAKSRPPAHPWRGPRELCRKWAHLMVIPSPGRASPAAKETPCSTQVRKNLALYLIWQLDRCELLRPAAHKRCSQGIYREPWNSCLNPNSWFESTQTSHFVFLIQVLCIMRLIELLLITKRLFFICIHCKPYATDRLHVCFYPFSFTSFRLRLGRCLSEHRLVFWFANSGLQRVQVNYWRHSHVPVAGYWRDWGREELAGLAASNGRWYLGHERT